MVRVFTQGRYNVYVYPEVGQPHHLPHCHVRWSDGSTQVRLPSLQVLEGTPLPPAVRDLLHDRLDEIVAAWNALNQERSIDDE